MKLNVHFSSATIDELEIRGKNVCVIDVFRSSTTIATALSNGAREIIPVGSIENAVKVSGSLMGDFVLRGGERNGKIIDGFNLGNSPIEYSAEAVKGKAIIYCTTNGTIAITKARYAKELIVGGFVNISKVVSHIISSKEDWEILCAGKENLFSFEDVICTGMLINLIQEKSKPEIKLSDSAYASLQLYKSNAKSISTLGNKTEHGLYLKSLNFIEDLKFCTKVDSIPVLPMLIDNVIKLSNKN